MPSERFHKLKSVKKRTFLKMAYKEFAMHSYEGASITRLVGDLKMAKGSIYQYFVDKEDLYKYLVDHAEKQLLEVVDKTCPQPLKTASFNKWLEKTMLVQVKFLLTIPVYAALFKKNKLEANAKNRFDSIKSSIIEAGNITNTILSPQALFSLSFLPFIIFDFIIETEEVDLYKIIISDSSIEVATDKLLYLCEAFLERPNY